MPIGTFIKRDVTSLAGLVVTYIYPHDENKALLLGRYLSIYGWILEGYMRDEDDQTVLQTILPPNEAAWLQQASTDTPTAIIFRLRQLIAGNMANLPLAAANVMEDRLVELESILGTCKRLLGSPIPPTYTCHTSRVLCLYLGLLPIALVGSSKAATGLLAILINVALLTYVFVGIDEIGVEIEHPFPLLPMWFLSNSVQDNISHQYVILSQQG